MGLSTRARAALVAMATGNPEAWRLATEALADVVALSAAVDAVAADGAVATRKGA